ncbi:ferritin-like domain-containing protein [Methylobacterium sp. J-090]|uniref:ferritin-like domain-containing protein n=1 Tax=Methylobacterium sp. J-090 TaxID=2836666 RepID=UPI001FBA1034|nr:ferritin-like domain-containing protein [Methylobacterium sp. J-090]MCJ2084298.1 ferritin-like domain-containing protein [Methylobacterium sp. J-090]
MTYQQQDTTQVPGSTIDTIPDYAAGRRAFLGTLGLGAAGALIMAGTPSAAFAQAAAPSAADVFNFALNFEYLGAEFYLHALNGSTLGAGDIEGTGAQGAVVGGHAVPFQDPFVRSIAQEFSADEVGHTRFLRSILGAARIARPAIDLNNSFTVFARFAGLVPSTGTFDAFASDNNFLLAAFVLEDVCVTALKGASPLIRNNEFLEAAAGFIATEGYQAGILRTLLAQRGQFTQAQQVSDLRDYFDGPSDIDQGIGTAQQVNIVPADANSIAFSRTPEQVRNIAYGTTNGQPGGFFPNGLNGVIR